MCKSALTIVVFLGFISLSFGGYNVDYLIDNCVSDAANRTLYLGQNGVSTYGIIRLTRENDYGTNLNCAMRIVAPDDDDYSIHIDVTYVDIYAPSDSVCLPDYLLLYGNLSLGIKYCGHGVPANNLVTLDSWFEVRFVSGPTDSNKDSGFDLHYNLFYPNNCTGKHVCNSGPNRCILPELVCDNRDNCGDQSDEWSSICGLSSGSIAAIVIMTLLIASIIAVIVAYCLCEKRWKKQRERQRQLSNTVMWSSRGVVTPNTSGANVEPPPAYTFSSQLDYANPYLNQSYSAPLGDAPVYSPPYSYSPPAAAAAAASSSSANGPQGSQPNNDKY